MHIRIDSNGKVVIPAEIREKLGIQDNGTYLHIEVNTTTKQIVLTPITRQHIDRFRGKYKGMGLMKAFLANKGK